MIESKAGKARDSDGVDDAIALLLAVRRANGNISTKALLDETGIPRASAHRIGKALAEAGILSLSRGKIAAGERCKKFISVRGTEFAQSCQQRFSGSRRVVGTVRAGELAPAATPQRIELCRPPIITQRKRLKIGFSNATLGNPWRTALVHALEYGAARLGNKIDWLAVRHADDSAVVQSRQIEELVGAGVDGLVVSPTNASEVRTALAAASRKSIAIVLVDRALGLTPSPTSMVGSSDAVIGRTTALWLAEYLGGTGRVIALAGRADAAPARVRLAAAKHVFDQFSGIEIVETVFTDWLAEKSHACITRYISSDAPPLEGVWCDSGLQGVGSLQAFVDAGYAKGTIPPHTGGDLNEVYKIAVRHEVPLAAVDYPPSMGQTAIEALCAHLCGDWIPRRVEVTSDVVLTRGADTQSVKPTRWADEHVRFDLSNDLILHAGLGAAYSPQSFRVRYRGNAYNRSAAQLSKVVKRDAN